ncbi:MAG: hypothetical protein IT380_10130 [Myxococcales bacterium]|nr:hypothetical protein [Myxococcales bacterium]
MKNTGALPGEKVEVVELGLPGFSVFSFRAAAGVRVKLIAEDEHAVLWVRVRSPCWASFTSTTVVDDDDYDRAFWNLRAPPAAQWLSEGRLERKRDRRLPRGGSFWTPGFDENGVFTLAWRWLRGRLDLCCDFPFDGRRLTAERLAAHALRRAGKFAVQACPLPERQLALRFASDLRTDVLHHVLGDRTGRIGQLVDVEPGVFLFAHGLLSMPPHELNAEHGSRLLAAVVNGVRLNRALDDAIDGWASGAGRRAVSLPVDHPCRPAWARLARASSRERARLFQEQRLLIRRARWGVHPMFVWFPAPLAFAPEDIPSRLTKNALWFENMIGGGPVFEETEYDLPEACSFSAFLSKNALQLESVGVGKRQMWSYAKNARWYPSRSTSLRRFAREVAEWWNTEVEPLGGDVLEEPELQPDTPLPQIAGAWVRPDCSVLPLKTVADIVKEGHQMRHCLATRVWDAHRGDAFFFSAVVGGERLTVEVGPGGNFQLAGIAGVRNRPPTERARAAIADWVGELSTGSAARLR